MKAPRRTWKTARRGCGALGLIVFAAILASIALVRVQGRRAPEGVPEYVALGSSFAAGAGLGDLQKGSPLLCARSVGGYPTILAGMLNLSRVDMSCGGAITEHLLAGGQFFQGPQVRVIDRRTRLVTITVGGNDVAYAGDLSLLAARNTDSMLGLATRVLWDGPKPAKDRDYDGVRRKLRAVLRHVRAEAPYATIVVATYPAIMPPRGTCGRLRLSASEVQLMREVGDRLAAATRQAAEAEGALLVDMHSIGRAHHACSSAPWTNGWTDLLDAPFHPTAQGAKATAEAIAEELRHHQQV